jgi:hypothetical protein
MDSDRREGPLGELLKKLDQTTGRSHATSDSNLSSQYVQYDNTIAANSDMELYNQQRNVIRNEQELNQR